MGIIDEIGDAAAWNKYYRYKTEHSHLRLRDVQSLLEFISEESYDSLAKRLRTQGYCFSPPSKRLINKFGTNKKRVIYSFQDDENQLLKLIAFLLYRYDGQMPTNCFSFRHNLGAKQAIRHMTAIKGVDELYCYKVDIHDYFNSIDIDLLLPLLADVIDDDDALLDFITQLLIADEALFEGEVIHAKRGAMAGTPIAPFLANIYLMEMDRHFEQERVPYARYSDDIILFAPTREALEGHIAYIYDTLARYHLEVNGKKEHLSAPGEPWEFLGVEYSQGVIDISPVTKRKLMGKVRRKARALHRWKLRRGASDEKAMQVFARVFNKKLLENPRVDEFTWSRWFFPLITTADTLKELDGYLQQNMRYVATGRYNHANYRIGYAQLKSCGYRSLVNAYYRFREEMAHDNR